MRNFLESANIRLLDDETVLIDKRFSLTGRKDPSRCRKMSDTRKDPDELTACLDKTLPIIFMDHQPGSWMKWQPQAQILISAVILMTVSCSL